MKKRQWLIAVIALASAQVALACGPRDALVFSCTSTKGKFVEVCQTPSHVTYAFGRKGQKPEMGLSVPTGKLDWQLSSGSGGGSEHITFRNGNTSYEVVISESYGRHWPDGSKDSAGTEASLYVETKGKSVATIECKEEGMRVETGNLKAKWRMYE